MHRGLASVVAFTAAVSLASGTASAAAPTLTAARSSKAIPYPLLPVIKVKADSAVRQRVGTALPNPCPARGAPITATPAHIEHYDSYHRVSNASVEALVSVYVFKSPAASAAALKAVVHAA